MLAAAARTRVAACSPSSRGLPAPRSVTGTGPVAAEACERHANRGRPAAYLAMRAYRDESHAPSPSDAAAPSGLRPAARASSGSRSLTGRASRCAVRIDPSPEVTTPELDGWLRSLRPVHGVASKMDAFSQPSVFPFNRFFDFQSFHRRFLVYTDEPPPAPIERLVRSRPPPAAISRKTRSSAEARRTRLAFSSRNSTTAETPAIVRVSHHRAAPSAQEHHPLSYRRRRARRSPPGPSSRRARSRPPGAPGAK